jgi:hypothetical protein
MNVSFYFKKESNKNNDVSSGQHPHDGGVHSDDGGVQPIHDGGVHIDDGGV